jgi:hypothetical protein
MNGINLKKNKYSIKLFYREYYESEGRTMKTYFNIHNHTMYSNIRLL